MTPFEIWWEETGKKYMSGSNDASRCRFAAYVWMAATKAEREACAKIAERTMAGDYDPGRTIAREIRAR